MKKIALTICGVAIIFVLIHVSGTSLLNKSDIGATKSQTLAAQVQLPGQDAAPKPLTMLIFGSCLAGAATLGRRHQR